jgi:hypothetical protein
VVGDPLKTKGGTAVMSNVSLAQASGEEVVLPARVQEALGQLIGSAKEGLLALSPCSRLLIDELRVNGRAEIRYRIVAPVDCATSEKVGRTEHCANQVAFDARPLRVA